MVESENLNEQNLVTVSEQASESVAAILVSVLNDEGIKAVATGGFTAGFRAEAPGFVSIKTFQRDADRAKAIIQEVFEKQKENLEEEDIEDENLGSPS